MKVILLLALCSVAFAALAPSGAPAPTDIKKGQLGSSLSANLQALGKTKIEGHLKDEPVFFDRYFIECFPKEAPKVKECKKWGDTLAAKDAQLFEQLKTMVKEGKDAVDGPTSAANEQISDKAEEKTDQQVAKKMMLLETMAKRSRLPMFHAGRRWPAHAGHKTPIAYCWDANATWYTRLFFWWSMQIVRWNANNLKFVKVDCNAPGHKIRLRARNDGRCGAQGGGYLGNGAPTATVAPVGTPSTEQYIGCDFDAYSRYSGAHEMFHALGFGHTQCRSDRDHYLDVTVPIDHQWRVIGNDIGTFDFDSVMLYPPGRNGKPKAKPKAGYLGNPANMGQRTSISAEDARILNQVYN